MVHKKSLPEEGERERERERKIEEEREEKEPKVGFGNPNLGYMRLPEAESDRGGHQTECTLSASFLTYAYPKPWPSWPN